MVPKDPPQRTIRQPSSPPHGHPSYAAKDRASSSSRHTSYASAGRETTSSRHSNTPYPYPDSPSVPPPAASHTYRDSHSTNLLHLAAHRSESLDSSAAQKTCKTHSSRPA